MNAVLTVDLLDEANCYERVESILHPESLQRPWRHLPIEHSRVQRRYQSLVRS